MRRRLTSVGTQRRLKGWLWFALVCCLLVGKAAGVLPLTTLEFVVLVVFGQLAALEPPMNRFVRLVEAAFNAFRRP